MPYVPTSEEARRLRRAIDRAAFSEGERIFWLTSFSLTLMAGVFVAVFATANGTSAALAAAGAAGFVFAMLVLYWRLRAAHLARDVPADRDLHGLGLGSRAQRAFTALMLRQAFTGRNPLAPRADHDPLAAFVERTRGARPAGES